MMTSRKWRRAAAWCVAVALFFVAYWKLRLCAPPGPLDTLSVDTYAQLLPMWRSAAASFAAGQVPLWNPHQGSGQPFLAEPSNGVFYPSHLLWLIVEPAQALEVSIVLHLIDCWWLTFLFARTLGLSRWASALAGLGYALSGCVVHQALWYEPALGSLPWLPLALLALERLLQRPAWRWAGALAVAVAMPLLAGWPQNLLYLLQAVAIYGGVRARRCCARGPDSYFELRPSRRWES
jgi:hypothetical protein